MAEQQPIDPTEQQEWLEALDSVVRYQGANAAGSLIRSVYEHAQTEGIPLPQSITTPFRNTIAPENERTMPGDLFMERRIRSLVRWNALAMVMRANDNEEGLGGHISSFSSSATLYDIGMNHFFRGTANGHPGDLVFYQGHSAPGMYARSYLEGVISETQLENFRREVDGNGLSSYPHPWLMPDYWQFPTVSMGLGPIQAIYQAHVMKYQSSRGLVDHRDRKVWCFMGDGESDEPESLGAIALAGREKLGNLHFVVNCNLQRLDGPVRGNGKIIQELEGVFRGAGWNVIKVIWGRKWDPLIERDHSGKLQQRMDEVCDGELQNCKFNGGAYTREKFFGKYPETLELVKDLSDDDIMYLNRGGHDPYKVYAAYAAACEETERPTAILAMTVKGYGTSEAGEANNETHSLKKLDVDSLKAFRDRFGVPISDKDLQDVPFYRPPEDSPEMRYMRERRAQLGGQLPKRRANTSVSVSVPGRGTYASQMKGSGKREISTTMSFVRILSSLIKDKEVGNSVVPIVPDEARTFGMEGMFRQLGIYSSAGQNYTPHDAGGIMYYKEDVKGQILEEGINESGAFSAWLAAATSYSVSDYPMIPFYIFYSMFGFQRIGDLAWAAGDSQARGFLIGATSGRTTLNGEGLQHQDGHSHLMATTIPNCISYDPTYSYELAVIIQDGVRRMFGEGENCFYYITTMNENYVHPDMPEGVEDGIVKGIYRLRGSEAKHDNRVQLMGAGSILREVEAAAAILEERFDVAADVWSMTSINELARDGKACQRWNLLNPTESAKVPYLTQQLAECEGPFVAATDYIRAHTDQIREFIPGSFSVLGTDGFGRSDTRRKLRQHFEVSREYVVLAALKSLADAGQIDVKVVADAIKTLGIDAQKPNPATA
ncbi:pyruvate dehydrogenase (acetyl-transferring), homodimeric type [Luminiphilus syltensis NOR5-1B]|uniref:Pyruvate dehydrogenase E1 component n=1 Tax=Luminiphilus syltensis NOR5-1B TaxID=565045 RepID=B8KWX0_9GAMM|nr:pyruvate dehydrogenase (acetyl-transferring), homodimeric type [Luminiphilus syltensis]EED36043.1 pyruvate dehydrogenase (acetyl-transferring), homodimeric type [Luminiphilus syltensis NOR5-1B]